MALNEKNLGTRGVDTHLGLANPTAHSKRADPLATDYVRSFLPPSPSSTDRC